MLGCFQAGLCWLTWSRLIGGVCCETFSASCTLFVSCTETTLNGSFSHKVNSLTFLESHLDRADILHVKHENTHLLFAAHTFTYMLLMHSGLFEPGVKGSPRSHFIRNQQPVINTNYQATIWLQATEIDSVTISRGCNHTTHLISIYSEK